MDPRYLQIARRCVTKAPATAMDHPMLRARDRGGVDLRLMPSNTPAVAGQHIPFIDLLLHGGGSYYTLIFYGKIRYKDYIGKEWTTQFCYLASREAAKAALLTPCEKFNHMK
jgi:hypothetical protein